MEINDLFLFQKNVARNGGWYNVKKYNNIQPQCNHNVTSRSTFNKNYLDIYADYIRWVQNTIFALLATNVWNAYFCMISF